MSITFDGERSKIRMWFAKKLLRVLVMTGIPSKVLKWEGFLFRVNKLGDMLSGRITAPVGGVVLYSCVHGVQVLTADYWLGSFSRPRYLHTMFGNAPDETYGFIGNHYTPDEDLIADGYSVIKHVPMVTSSPYYAANPPRPDGAGAPDTWSFDAMSTPVVTPALGGEAFWTNINASVYISSNPIDRSLSDSNLNFFTANGSNLGNRLNFSFENASVTGISHIYSFLPAKEQSVFRSNGMEYEFYVVESGGANVRVLGLWYKTSLKSVSLFYIELSDTVKNMPWCLQVAVQSSLSSVRPAGNYTYTDSVDGYPITMTAIDLTNTVMGGMPSAPEEACFTATPADEKWRLSFHFHNSGTGEVNSVDSSQFLPLLDILSTHPDINPLTSWADALYMLQQFFPRPNHNYTVPYDSSMFHDEDGDVYVWTRKYGAVKFTNTGMFIATPTIPTVVTDTDGIRPTITYAGNSMYLCVCESLETPLEVHAIYYGSPFDTWNELPMPALEDGILIHVRPVEVISGSITLLGVIEDSEGLYYFAFLRYKDGIGEWNRTGNLNVTRPDIPYQDEGNWSIGVFGNGNLSKLMSEYLTQPVGLPQMPVGPYAGYAGGMP